MQVFLLLAGPLDAAAGEAWVHGSVEGSDGGGGETALDEVDDA